MGPRARAPAVAGRFYPGSREQLARAVDALLDAAAAPSTPRLPKALIVPHAGYVYSGPIAASAYRLLQGARETIRRVVLIGPSHHVRLEGLAGPGVALLSTPLGDSEVDQAAIDAVGIADVPEAHAREHSLEVQLPFLQRLLPHAKIVPLVAGRAGASAVAEQLEQLWGGEETLILISSDLSHYLPYAEGQRADRRTAEKILALDPSPLEGEEACGCVGINGLIRAARAHRLRAELVDLRSSGDTSVGRAEVVGYGAFAFYEGGVPC